MPTLETVAHQYNIARGLGAADNTLSAALATAGDFGSKPATAIDINKGLTNTIKVNGIFFTFCGETDNSAFTWKLYGYKSSNGPAELAADGTGIIGTQKIVKFPHNDEESNILWADTIVVSNEYWFKDVESTDIAGNNSVAKCWLDACGYRYWVVEIPTSDTNMASYYGYW